MSGVVHEHNGPTFGHVYCLRCQETARDLGIEALWTYLPEYVTCSGNALSGPVAGDGGETGTGGPPERHGAVQGVTDGDRERAIDVMSRASGDADPFGDVREAIAAALAEERERALRDAAAWFALQDDEGGPDYYAGPDRIPVYETHRWAAAHLTERAEETTE